MALIPRRNPLTSLLNFAADRDREANSIGSVITKLAGPALGQMGVQTEEEPQPQPAVMRGPAPQAQPLGAFTGPPMAPTPVMSDEELKANVFPGESGGDYNALFGYANRPGGKFEGVNLTDMTVNEVIDFTNPSGPYGQWVKGQIGRVATPTGAFQVVGSTLKDAVRGLGLTGDEPYNEATQDAVGRWIFENQGPEAWEAWGKSGGAVSGGAGAAAMNGGAGADNLGGNNVEDILAQLYPQMSPEQEKQARRKDVFSALSQGFSALSQGRPIDFSEIKANQENRKRQAVLDMRERERARSAASLVYSQTGDRDLAAGIATGAISYGDVVNERELKRVQTEADRVRVQQEQANGRLSGIVEKMWPDLGLPESVKESVLAGIAAGDDPNTIFTLNEQAKVAEAAREADEEEAVAAETRDAAIEAFSTGGGPIEGYAARLLSLDPKMDVDTALARAKELVGKPEGKDFEALAEAQAVVDSGAINPNTGQPFGSVGEVRAADMFPPKDVAAPQPTVTINPDNTITITPAAPAAIGAAPAVTGAAVAPMAPAPAGVAGAFSQQLGGMKTGIPAMGAPAAPTAAALPLNVAQDVAALENTMVQTAQRKQELETALETAPDDIARAAIETDLAAVNLEQAQLNLQTAEASAEPDAALKALSVQKAQEDLVAAELENEKRRRDMQGIEDEAETEEQKAVRRELRAMQSTDTVMREGTKLLDLTKDWKSGVVPGLVATGARLLSQSETGRAERLLAGVKDNIALDNLIAMKQDSPTGGALGSVSNAEGDRLENRFGSLDVTGNTTDLRDNVGSAMNAYNDAIHGTPAQILKLYEAGDITAEQADAYSTRLVSSLDRDTATIMTENGPATNLGLSANRDTIYGLAKPLVGDEELGLTPEERDLFEQFR